ncbi:hypothetical protein CLOM_g14772 [Closterium sp. NIES-68]|nr:hypothetical protein CLOM_g14772 [Closterium sp. NIES-68]GJP82989.1 hypothetical protein CLOP_g13201 [Closterium sp. NIES-67]
MASALLLARQRLPSAALSHLPALAALVPRVLHSCELLASRSRASHTQPASLAVDASPGAPDNALPCGASPERRDPVAASAGPPISPPPRHSLSSSFSARLAAHRLARKYLSPSARTLPCPRVTPPPLAFSCLPNHQPLASRPPSPRPPLTTQTLFPTAPLPAAFHALRNASHRLPLTHIAPRPSFRLPTVAFSASAAEPPEEAGEAELGEEEEAEAGEREEMEYDVVVVGAGPAGLAAAIRLKQVDEALSVCVVEKGAQAGAHTLSGNVFEPRALDELLPHWRDEGAPISVAVARDRFVYLTKSAAVPLPPPSSNHGNYVISLSELVRWMAGRAEDMGVEIYPGFAASKVLYSSTHGFHNQRRVSGIATNDVGIAKDASRKPSFQRGMALKGRLTILAEGCRGSLSEEVMAAYSLRLKAGAQHQTYALGVKEVWEVPEAQQRPGEVVHSIGYPLDSRTYGGGFLYHMDRGMVALGLVVALDYRNPYLSPYQEFQRWKLHPSIRRVLEGGRVVQYGARTLNEGGLQSIPGLVFPGGALVGCAAGFLNVPKIKGSHTAIKSGMVAAEAAAAALAAGGSGRSVEADAAVDAHMADTYPAAMRSSWLWEELHRARNIRPGFKHGLVPGIINAAFETYISRGRSPWTLAHHAERDNETLTKISDAKPIDYPKPDGTITFDIPTSLYRSSTNHEHDQPPHLRLRDPAVPTTVNLPLYGGPEGRYCPARVYEYVQDDKGEASLSINAQNCLHCKACIALQGMYCTARHVSHCKACIALQGMYRTARHVSHGKACIARQGTYRTARDVSHCKACIAQQGMYSTARHV